MKQIVNNSEYEAIMARINELVEVVDDNTSKEDKYLIELDFLTDLVVAYEKTHFSIGKPVLCDVIKTRMIELNLSQKSLAEMLGISSPRVSEYLNGKSLPTLQIAQKIHKQLNIDGNLLFAAL